MILFSLCCLLSLGAVYGQDIDDCPKPAECLVNPCQDATCDRFLNAQCVVDRCNGSGVCLAVFRHFKHNKIITNCDIESCETKSCPSRRVCVEEINPPFCPEGPGTCRQIVHTRCELPPKPMPPTSCDLLLCEEGHKCVLRDTKRGPTAVCRIRRPRNCEELGPCDEGMECYREGDDLHVRCRALSTNLTRTPRTCAELPSCPDGYICMVFGREGKERARCVVPPKVRNCTDLRSSCESQFLTCRDRDEGPVCEATRNCDELSCPDGLRCVSLPLGGMAIQVTTCIPENLNSNSNCDDANCAADEVCLFQSFLDRGTNFVACYPKELVKITSSCDNPDFCNGEDEVCAKLSQPGGNSRFDFCVHGQHAACSADTGCEDPGKICVANGRACVLQSAKLEFGNRTCEQLHLNGGAPRCKDDFVCMDFTIKGDHVGTFCSRASCGDVGCSDVGEECVGYRIGEEFATTYCAPKNAINKALQALK